MFDFEEFLYNIATAEDYMDIYDYIAMLDDAELYNSVYDVVSDCECNNEDVCNVYMIIESRLFSNVNTTEEQISEEVEEDTPKTIKEYIQLIDTAYNDDKLAEIIHEMEDTIENENLTASVLQIFKNNRSSTMEDKKERIKKVINQFSDNVKVESIDKLTEDINGESVKDKEVDNEDDKMKVGDDMKTTLDYLQDRIGQKMTLGEFNTTLQSLFGRYNEVFILFNDLYNMDKDEPQELVISDDDELYTITYNIIDIMNGTIEVTDVTVE